MIDIDFRKAYTKYVDCNVTIDNMKVDLGFLRKNEVEDMREYLNSLVEELGSYIEDMED